ncbi:MAG: RNA methyltransferase [Acidimicrobiia bacterium]|nr:RNA methyltransferase [Acidimicrobiia bacterium]
MRNRRVAAVARLHDHRTRRSLGRTIIEGPSQIADAVAAGADIIELFALDPGHLPAAVTVPPTIVTAEVLARMAGTLHPRGPLAVVSIPRAAALQAADVVVLWDITDPGNAGAIVRSAAAFGFAVATTTGSTDVWSPKAIRAAAGAQFRTPHTELADDALAALTSTGLTLMAAVAVGGQPVEEVAGGLTGAVALLIGSEAHGLPEVVTTAAIPVSLTLDGGVESLNAAVAAGLLMYLLRSRRHRPGGS